MTFPPKIVALLGLAGLLLVAGPVAAARDPATMCDAAAAKVAKSSGVPIDILLAISRVETGRGGAEPQPWPWAINASGKGTWYDDEAQAVSAANDLLNNGSDNFDVGCFQLNAHWHGQAFPTVEDMFDPMQNTTYAAKFLLDLYQETGDWPQAVAAYHSRTDALAAEYLNKVADVMAGPTGDPGPEPAAAPAPRENLYPLLQVNDQAGINGSLVPVNSGRGPLFGGNS